MIILFHASIVFNWIFPCFQTELGSNGQPPLGFGQTPQPIEGHQILTNGDTSPLGTQEDDEDNDTDHSKWLPLDMHSIVNTRGYLDKLLNEFDSFQI